MINRRCRKCFCINNNNPHCVNQNMLKKACQNTNRPAINYKENCNCGFDDDEEKTFDRLIFMSAMKLQQILMIRRIIRKCKITISARAL